MGKFMEENGVQLLLGHHTHRQGAQPQAENAPDLTNACAGQRRHIQPHRSLPAGFLRRPVGQMIQPGIVLLRQKTVNLLQKRLGRRKNDLLGGSRHQERRAEHPGDGEAVRPVKIAGQNRQEQAQQEQHQGIDIGGQPQGTELTQLPLRRLFRLLPVGQDELIGLGHAHILITPHPQLYGQHRHQGQHYDANEIAHAADPFCPGGDPGIVPLPQEDAPDIGGKGQNQRHPHQHGAGSAADLLRFGQGHRLHLRHGAAHFPAQHAGSNEHHRHGEQLHHGEGRHHQLILLGEIHRLPPSGEGHRQENPAEHQRDADNEHRQPFLFHWNLSSFPLKFF